MIPTSVSSSPASAVTASPIGSTGHNGSPVLVGMATATTTAAATAAITTTNNSVDGQQSYATVMIGIASVILEGRGVADENYHPPPLSQQQLEAPSTSRAAAAAFSGSGRHHQSINITTNPHDYDTSFYMNNLYHQMTAAYAGATSYSSAADSTHQRWTQKLCQLRQASPTTVAYSSAYESQMALAVEAQSVSDTEMPLPLLQHEVERFTLGGASGGAASVALAASSGAEHLLHSLQSLATTCLRGGGGVTADSGANRYRYATTTPCHVPVAPRASPFWLLRPTTAVPMSKPGTSRSAQPNVMWLESKGSSVSAAKTATTASSTKCTASGGSSGAYTQPPQQGPHCDQFLRKMGLPGVAANSKANGVGSAGGASGGAASDTNDAEEHFCDMSYVNITCSRWRAYCNKMQAILARGEPVCIEIYLGPLSHKILLEQWILTQRDRLQPPTMTLPSLCSAIRSQLYFSQISAWCDVIKKSDVEFIYDTGRVIYPLATGAAGDLAMRGDGHTSSAAVDAVTATLNASTSSNQQPSQQRPQLRLNIFYRIKPYDSTASFNSKPNVHNFPNVNVTESFSIAVCLKSLPRLNGGIPKIMVPVSATIAPAMSTGPSAPKESVNDTGNGSRRSQAVAELRRAGGLVGAVRTSAHLNCDTPKILSGAATTSSTAACAVLPPSAVRRAASGSGKYKCKFFIDEDELLETCADEVDGDADDDAEYDAEFNTNGGRGSGVGDSSNSSYSSSATATALNSNNHPSHREKQLMKYRKRMLKRDKKHHRKPTMQATLSSAAATAEACSDQRKQPVRRRELRDSQPMAMEEGEEIASDGERSTITVATCQRRMISTGTQTPELSSCQQCGSEKSFVCLKCLQCSTANTVAAASELDGEASSTCSNSSDFIRSPRNKAELLLQAIQRTPKAAARKHKKQTARDAHMTALNATQNNNQQLMISGAYSSAAALGVGCQVCKRQKTQHNFDSSATADNVEGGCPDTQPEAEAADDGGVKEPDISDASAGSSVQQMDQEGQLHVEKEAGETIVEEECFSSTTKLTPHIERCTSSMCTAKTTSGVKTPPPPQPLLVDCDASSAAQFKTPTGSLAHPSTLHAQHKQTPTLSLLQLSCSYKPHSQEGGGSTGDNDASCTPKHNSNALLPRKGVPKVNLTPIFCAPQALMTTATGSVLSGSSAVFVFDSGVAANQPVQKSYSAPTLPNSPSLSPRFAKQAAAFNRRRARHLSDRSDRSSLGSDEQLYSDEDLECGPGGAASPATSPLKARARYAAAYALGRRLPLLGNLEESLLQRRLLPKMEVLGFKVLLGASGLFCPEQLTIPAAAFFYELHGETLSTPYVCEIRLPRKGYYVPRIGNVQATLLNPMGTVVRMFVIPYDLRDMPPLHQTFIRQRILADASVTESDFYSNNTGHSNVNGGDGEGDVGPFMRTAADELTNNNIDFSHISNNNNTPYYNNNNHNNNKYRLSPSGVLHCVSNLGHFISADHMKRLRYSIHLRFQTSRSGRLSLHTDIRLLISRRTDCDTAAAHAKGVLEAPNDLVTDTVMPTNPKYSARQENVSKI